ncbi:putative phage abortive infection protein [Enterobacter hormaechei]
MCIDTFMAWWDLIWTEYYKTPDPYVGIATAIGALVTALALVYTAKAAKAASKSTKVAQDSLDHTMNNTRRDEFARHFTLLLELHNEQHEIVKKYLDSVHGKSFFESVRAPITLKEAHQLMHGQSFISPYMRILYHALKYINNSYYDPKADLKEKKKYSSLIRSLIRNDVLYLVALNSAFTNDKGVPNQYVEYQSLLHKFSFFDHAQFYKTLANEDASAKSVFDAIKTKNDGAIALIIHDILHNTKQFEEKIEMPLPLIVSSLYQNSAYEYSSDYLFNLHNEFSEIYSKRKSIYLMKLKKDLKIEASFKFYIGMFMTSNPKDEILKYRNKKITHKIESYPVVDTSYIENALVNFKDSDYKSDINLSFFNINNYGYVSFFESWNFDQDCREYILDMQHKSDVEEDKYWPEVEFHIDFWKSYEGEISAKRVS